MNMQIETVIAATSAIIALLSLVATIFIFARAQKRSATLQVYQAQLDALKIGLENPHVLNWEPKPIGKLTPEQTKVYYQYIFILLNVAEMAELSESIMLEDRMVVEGYIKYHEQVLRAIPREITRTFSRKIRHKLRAKLPGSNW